MVSDDDRARCGLKGIRAKFTASFLSEVRRINGEYQRKQQDRIEELTAQLQRAGTLRGRIELISEFEAEIGSFQYAISVMRDYDETFGLDSSKHISVLSKFVEAARETAKAARRDAPPKK